MATRFVTSATRARDLGESGLPEVAFAGRSNVGKSSLIAALFGRTRLVRTSHTPGRTQTLNLFVHDERLAVVDLPGYGYAKLSKKQRDAMAAMIRDYVIAREPLRGVVQLVDARRDPVSEYDRQMAAWVLENGRPLLLVVNKIDLVAKNKRLHQLRRIERQLGVPAGASVACSAKTGEGKDELWRRLRELAA